ncbi:MAG TPA: hypothetical protein VF042_08345, partial [Gemmatimonadaceae bacterium]
MAVETGLPERRSRAVFALIIAIAAATFTYLQFARRDHSDFGMVWYGARALMAGMDPYSQIGPGKAFDYEWSLIYPVPALVLVSPLSWMSEQYATAVFVGVSCFLLAYGITR